MGKAKKRSFRKAINTGENTHSFFVRHVETGCSGLCNKKIKIKDFGLETKDIISLFGISAEELAEAGAAYEDLQALKGCFSLVYISISPDNC